MATYAQTNNKTIDEAFNEFHRKNPHIYEEFVRYVKEAHANGKRKMSAKTILGKIRWDSWIRTSGDEYKLNDAFTSRFARMFCERNPKAAFLFELRELRSK